MSVPSHLHKRTLVSANTDQILAVLRTSMHTPGENFALTLIEDTSHPGGTSLTYVKPRAMSIDPQATGESMVSLHFACEDSNKEMRNLKLNEVCAIQVTGHWGHCIVNRDNPSGAAFLEEDAKMPMGVFGKTSRESLKFEESHFAKEVEQPRPTAWGLRRCGQVLSSLPDPASLHGAGQTPMGCFRQP